MRHRGRAALIAAAFALAAPAGAQAATPRDAAAFGRAAVLAAAEIRATAPDARIDLAAVELPRCQNATTVAAGLNLTPEARDRFLVVVNTAVRWITFRRTVPALERFVATLSRVRTTDRTLRSARAGWRVYVADLAVVAATPLSLDLCAQLEAWAAGGAAGPLLPELDLAAVTTVFQRGAGSRQDAKIKRGARRLARRGVSAKRAERFSVQGMLAEHLRISQSITDLYAPPGSQTT